LTKTYGTIGKRNGQIIDYVRSFGRTVSLEELVQHLGVRKNSLKSRNMNLLVELELLEEVEGGYITPTEIEDRLANELRESGQSEAERLQREKYERERQAWREEEPANNTVLINSRVRQDVSKTMTRYIPTKADDGIFYHGPECSCWMCDESAPEYVELEQELVA
jgi:hypothetical protein